MYYAPDPFRSDKSDWWAIIKIKPIGQAKVKNVIEAAYQNKMQIHHQLVDVDCNAPKSHPRASHGA